MLQGVEKVHSDINLKHKVVGSAQSNPLVSTGCGVITRTKNITGSHANKHVVNFIGRIKQELRIERKARIKRKHICKKSYKC